VLVESFSQSKMDAGLHRYDDVKIAYSIPELRGQKFGNQA